MNVIVYTENASKTIEVPTGFITVFEFNADEITTPLERHLIDCIYEMLYDEAVRQTGWEDILTIERIVE